MLSTDKRASLSSKLLSSKEAAARAEDTAASMRARAERLVASRRPMVRETRDATSAEPSPYDTVLVAKGGASASGFRPLQWTYELGGSPHPSDNAGTVTPFPASAPAPASSTGPVGALVTPQPRRRTVTIAVAGFGVLALIVSSSVLMLSRAHEVSEPQSLAAVPVEVKPLESKPEARDIPENNPVAVVTTAAPSVPEKHEAAKVALHSAEPPTPAVTPPSVAPPRAEPTDSLSPKEISDLVARGDQLLANGDIVAARVFYVRAAEHGNAAAATSAGKTFDPLFLEEVHARGIRPDIVMAAQWYLKGSAGGDEQADLRMKQLIAKYAG